MCACKPDFLFWFGDLCLAPVWPFVYAEEMLKFVAQWWHHWFWHVTSLDSLSKTILQGTLAGGQRRCRQRKWWMDNIKEWTSLPVPKLLTRAPLQKRLEEDLCWIVPHVLPTILLIEGLDWTETEVAPLQSVHTKLCWTSGFEARYWWMPHQYHFHGKPGSKPDRQHQYSTCWSPH